MNLSNTTNSTSGRSERDFDIVMLISTILTLLVSCYICGVLIRHQKRYYHLWNRIALCVFICISINQVFRLVLQSYDVSTQHAQLSDGWCQATFAVSEFFTSFTEISYIFFQLVMMAPLTACAEPESRDKITHTLFVPWMAMALLFSLLCVVVPIALGTQLEHRHAWCWISHTSPMRWVFSYIPSLISLIIALCFIGWVVFTETRVPKGRVLCFAIVQLCVVLVYCVFAMMAAADANSTDPDTHQAVFDLLAFWITVHEVARAAAFIIGEKLYPPKRFLCSGTYHGGSSSNHPRGGGVAPPVPAVATATSLGVEANSTYGTQSESNQAPVATASDDTGVLLAPTATVASSLSQQQQPRRERLRRAASRNAFDDDAIVDDSGNLADDTLTYFVLHLQRRSADLDADFIDSASDGSSAYAGGRGASMRDSSSSAVSQNFRESTI